jgi:hypothetical protein
MPGPLYDDEDCRKFGENLKKMREKWNLTQAELANLR